MNNYFTLVNEIKEINRQLALRPVEMGLLDLIANAYDKNEIILVGDLISRRELATPATLHVALKKLVRKRLAITKANQMDGRQKSVTPTKLTLDHYKKLNQLVSKVKSR